MNESNQTTSIHILNKTYHVKCPKEQMYALRQAALYLDEKMREIVDTTHLRGQEHIAIMVALNLAHEILSLHSKEEQFQTNLAHRLQTLHKKVTDSLSTNLEELPL